MFDFDRSDLNFGFASAGLLVVAVLLGVLLAWGGATGSGFFGFVLTGLAFAAAPSLSLKRGVAFAIAGGLLTFLAFAAAENAGWSAFVLGVVAALVSLATARSPGVEVSWWLLGIWTLLAFELVESGAEILAAISFVLGSSIALALVALLRRDTRAKPTVPETDKTIVTSLIWFATGKAIAVALGVLVGFWWLPTVPYWIALTVLIVAQPDDRSTAHRAASRSLGTVIGVALGALSLVVAGESAVWTAIFLAGIVFCQMLFLRVNYALYITFLTALIVVAASLITGEAGDVGWSRIIATIVGVGLALALTALVSPSKRVARASET